MRFIRLSIIGLCALVLLSGCGESFRTTTQTSVQESELVDDNGFRNGVTDLTQDQSIVKAHESEIRKVSNNIIPFGNQLKAADLTISAHSSNPDVVQTKISIFFDCENRLEMTSSASVQQLSSGQAVHIGADAGYTATLICTTTNCSENTIVLRDHNRFRPSILFLGMAYNGRNGNTISFLSRDVNLYPYYRKYPNSNVLNCPTDDDSGEDDDRSVGERIVDELKDSAKEYLAEEILDRLSNLF